MSYTSLEEIPFNIRRCYDEEDLVVWMTKYNEFYTQIKDGQIDVPDYCQNDAMYARELAFDACKYLPSSRFVEASSTVEVLDRQNEVADIESYYDGSKEFIDFGGIGIQQHSSKVISTIWKAYKGIDSVTGQPAIFTCENYFRGKKMYDDAWYAVLNGGLSEKSIGSRIDPAKTKTECDESGCHNRVYADQWFELSSVFRGANPRTYIIDKHETLKSFGNVHIVAINDRYKMCPIKERYLSFKSDIADVDPAAKVHYLHEGMMYVSGSNRDAYKQIISQHYPEAQVIKGSIEKVGSFTFIVDRSKGEYTDIDVFDELMQQVDGEREAIEGYAASMKYLDTTDLKPEVKESLKKILDEIISDEQRHIGTLEKAIGILSEEFHVNFEEGEDEAKEIAEKGDSTGGACPEGQHQHAGITGCHDIAREHPGITSGQNHSVHYLASMPDSELRNLLISITSLLREYPREKIESFLATPAGKKYIRMYAEYQRRRKASEYTESKKMSDKVEETALKEDAVVDIEDKKGCKEDDLKEAIPEARPDASDDADDSANSGPITEEVQSEADPMPASPTEAIPDEGLKSDSDLPTAIANLANMLVSINSKIEVMSARLDGLENMTKMQMDTKDTITDKVMDEVSEESAMEEKDGKFSPEVPPVKEEGAEEEKDKESDNGNEEGVAAEDKTEEESATEEKPAEGESKDEDNSEDESEDKSEDKSEAKTEDKSEEKTSDENEKKPDIKEKSDDWDDVSALTRRINHLRDLGVTMEGLTGGNSISAGNIKLKAVSGVSLVDTPAPAPYTPASATYKEAGGSMFDQMMNAMESMPSKQFSENIRKGVFNQ